MAKKIFLTTIYMLLFILALTTISFCESGNMTTKLGNEVTSSMNKTEKNMDDFSKKSELDKAGSAIKDGVEDIGDDVEDLGDKNETEKDNRAVAGRTGNYSTSEIQTTGQQQQNGMTRNVWIWIVMVVVALIIIAAVWFYATSQNQRQQ